MVAQRVGRAVQSCPRQDDPERGECFQHEMILKRQRSGQGTRRVNASHQAACSRSHAGGDTRVCGRQRRPHPRRRRPGRDLWLRRGNLAGPAVPGTGTASGGAAHRRWCCRTRGRQSRWANAAGRIRSPWQVELRRDPYFSSTRCVISSAGVQSNRWLSKSVSGSGSPLNSRSVNLKLCPAA